MCKQYIAQPRRAPRCPQPHRTWGGLMELPMPTNEKVFGKESHLPPPPPLPPLPPPLHFCSKKGGIFRPCNDPNGRIVGGQGLLTAVVSGGPPARPTFLLCPGRCTSNAHFSLAPGKAALAKPAQDPSNPHPPTHHITQCWDPCPQSPQEASSTVMPHRSPRRTTTLCCR